MAPLAAPDDDVLPVVEYLARLVAQLVLPDLGGRRTVVENFECFEPDAGNTGIERALPEFLNRVRASNNVAAGRQDLPIRRVQRRQPGTIALGRSRRELCVRCLDSAPNPVGVRRLDYTANESDKSYSAKTIKMDDSSANSYARSAIAPLPLLQNLFARLPNSQGRIECVPRAAG